MNGHVSPRNAGGWEEEPSSEQLRAAAVHGQFPNEDFLMRKPTRLDAIQPLGAPSAKSKKKKKQYNLMDQL